MYKSAKTHAWALASKIYQNLRLSARSVGRLLKMLWCISQRHDVTYRITNAENFTQTTSTHNYQWNTLSYSLMFELSSSKILKMSSSLPTLHRSCRGKLFWKRMCNVTSYVYNFKLCECWFKYNVSHVYTTRQFYAHGRLLVGSLANSLSSHHTHLSFSHDDRTQ